VKRLTISLLLFCGCHAAEVTLYRSYESYPSTGYAEIYPDSSKIPYRFFKIGQVTARGGATVSNDALLRDMLDEGSLRGADGIISVEFYDRPYVGSLPYMGVTTVNKPGGKGVLIRFERDAKGNPIQK
jgi:hypothetical protein